MNARSLTCLGILLLSTSTAALAESAGRGEVATRLVLFVGSPAAPGEEDQPLVLVSGSVLSLRSGGVPSAARQRDVGELAARLKRVMRLGEISQEHDQLHQMRPDESASIPVNSNPQIDLEATLLGSTPELATYRIHAREGADVLADTRLTAELGQQAVVGIVDGSSSPYLFLVVAPTRLGMGAPELHRASGKYANPPRKLTGEAPQYTEAAREAGVEGIVILQTRIDDEGRVAEVKVVQGLSKGLSEAAAEAVSNWTFAPAVDQAGNPVVVDYTITINFQLPDGPDER